MANDKKTIVSEYEISEILKYASKRVAEQKLVTGTPIVNEEGKTLSGNAALLATTTNRKDAKDINSIFKNAFKESKKVG